MCIKPDFEAAASNPGLIWISHVKLDAHPKPLSKRGAASSTLRGFQIEQTEKFFLVEAKFRGWVAVGEDGVEELSLFF